MHALKHFSLSLKMNLAMTSTQLDQIRLEVNLASTREITSLTYSQGKNPTSCQLNSPTQGEAKEAKSD